MIIPEIIVHQAILIIINLIKHDMQINDEENTVLHKTFKSKIFQRYNFYDQCKNLFLESNKDNPRAIDGSRINLAFNPNTQGLPTIHITSPSGNPKDNSLNVGEGIGETGEYERREANNLSVVVTSENYLEVLAIHSILKAMMIRIYDHLSLAGLENLTIAHREIVINPSLVPKTIHAKALTLSFDIDNRVKDFEENILLKEFESLIFESELFPQTEIDKDE